MSQTDPYYEPHYSLQDSIINSLSDGIVAMNKDGKILFINDAITRIFGYSKEQVLDKSINYLLPELEHQELHSYQMLGVCYESAAMHRDGHAVSVELTITPIEDADQELYTAIIHDNSDRKSIELLKQKFRSAISYELRTPLTSIKGSLGLVIQRMAEQLPQQTRELIAIAANNSDRLLHVIEDILELDSSDTNCLSYYFETFDLSHFLEGIVKENTPYATQHGIKLALDNQVGAGNLFADQGRLQQVMYNLITNAVSVSPEGSTVKVIAEEIFEQVRITVVDMGPGLPDELRDNLFEKLSELPLGISGLGLSISHSIIHKHQAELKYRSTPDGGTCFYFELPLQPQTE